MSLEGYLHCLNHVQRSVCGVIVFMSLIGNTRKLIKKLDVSSIELNWDNCLAVIVDKPFLLLAPTYAEESTDLLRDFLDHEQNHSYCKGIIGAGNRNFAHLFCYTAKDLCREYNLPLLHRLEFQGSAFDIERIKEELDKIG